MRLPLSECDSSLNAFSSPSLLRPASHFLLSLLESRLPDEVLLTLPSDWHKTPLAPRRDRGVIE